jgi:TonB family protein
MITLVKHSWKRWFRREEMPRNQRRKSKMALLAFAALLLTLPVSSPAQEGRKVISRTTPVYPEAAKRLAITGTVKVEVVVAPDGHVKETKIIGGHPLLVESVQEALKDWKYEPASGESAVLLEFHFHP